MATHSIRPKPELPLITVGDPNKKITLKLSHLRNMLACERDAGRQEQRELIDTWVGDEICLGYQPPRERVALLMPDRIIHFVAVKLEFQPVVGPRIHWYTWRPV